MQGTPWGALELMSRGPPLAAGIEDRLAQFAELAATAIANAQSRSDCSSQPGAGTRLSVVLPIERSETRDRR